MAHKHYIEHLSNSISFYRGKLYRNNYRYRIIAQPYSVLIILGDFNKANLSCELPKYRQHVTCPTRDSKILDHCFTTIKNAYHSVPRAALGLSDHCLIHLIPIYRQELKSAKPVVKTVKRWTNETERGFTSLSRPYWLECFWGCCKWSGWAHRDCHFIYQFMWRYVHSYQDSFNLQQWQTMVHCKTQTATSGQRRCSCINRPNTHWKRRSE